jgi:glycosyltransferase involved in cell wall biosynthesis
MKILFICNEYPPGKSGGIGSVTRSLARQLVLDGHEVFVAGLYGAGYGQKNYEEDQGVKVWRRRFRSDIGLIGGNYSFSDKLLLYAIKRTGILRRDTNHGMRSFNRFVDGLIRQFNIDIVEWPDFNEHFLYLESSFTWPALPVPLVVKFHGSISYLNRQMNEKVDPVVYALEKKHLERADALVSVSRNTAGNYQSFYELKVAAAVLYNSIDIPAYRYMMAAAPKTIVYTGSLTRLKGIYSLIRAWNFVKNKVPDARLRIFGKGNRHDPMKDLEPVWKDSVQFEGFVNRDMLFEAMSSAAAAIFPSFTECFAIAPLEAMAIGCPVIYTERVSGPELIETGVNGLLVDPDNYQQMADAMIRMLERKDLREQFSIGGRDRIEQRFSIARSAKDHISFYQQVIDGYGKNSLRS